MTTKSVSRRRSLQALLTLATLALAFVAPSACNQPLVRCHAAGGDAIARYTVFGAQPSATPACANVTLPGTGSPDPATFLIGVESYVPSPADPNASNEVSSLALNAEWIGTRIVEAQLNAARDPSLASAKDALTNYPYGTATPPAPPPAGGNLTNHPYAWGKFDTVYPDAQGMCKVSSMTASDLEYPDLPSHLVTCTQNPTDTACSSAGGTCTFAQPTDFNGLCELSCAADADCASAAGGATSCTNNLVGAASVPPLCRLPDAPKTQVKYEWSKVRVYVTPTSIGNQTFGDLVVTQDGCSISYHVSILAPHVACNALDSSGNPTGSKDAARCDPNPDGPTNTLGSGIPQAIKPSCENIGTDASPDYECLPPANDPLNPP